MPVFTWDADAIGAILIRDGRWTGRAVGLNEVLWSLVGVRRGTRIPMIVQMTARCERVSCDEFFCTAVCYLFDRTDVVWLLVNEWLDYSQQVKDANDYHIGLNARRC